MSSAAEEYAALKLEVAQAVRTLGDLARRAGDEDGEGRARSLLARLAEDRFNLAVVGLFNRGKSSLINALLGTDRLPTGVLPVTSAITTVGYGDREQLLIHFRGSPFPTQARLEDLAGYVSEPGNPGNRLGIERAEIRLPSRLLRLGFFFVDTPGVGSAIAANTETTRRFLPEIDAAVFVTSFEGPLGQADVDLLADLRAHVRTVFVVANKADLLRAEERDAALRFMRERLPPQPDGAAARILAVSARTGAGIPELHTDLSKFLAERKLPELLLAIVRRAQAIGDRQAVRLAMSTRTRSDPTGVGAESEWRAEVGRLRAEATAVLAGLRAAVAAGLEIRMGPAVDAYCAPSGGPHEPLDRWLDRQRETLQTHLLDIARPHARRLAELLVAPDRIAARLGSDYDLPPRAAADPALGLDEIAVTPPAPLPVIDWHAPAPPRWAALPLLRSRARRIAERANATALAGRRAALSALVVALGEEWTGRVAHTFEKRFASGVAATERARSAAPDALAQAELDAALQRLAMCRERIAAGSLRDPVSATRPAGLERVPRRCPFCAAVRTAVFDFMSGEQYDLAVSELRRREHLSHAFCAQHLWEFERLASPQGLCIAYAPVLAQLGERLSALSEATSRDAIRAGVHPLRPAAQNCPACRVARRAEAATLRGDRPSNALLCLPHLSYALEHASDVEAARALLATQAELVRRVADDMQNHALKADALRRDLLTESESTAHVRGVAVVAGERGVHSTIGPAEQA